jgi:hypothetical protein
MASRDWDCCIWVYFIDAVGHNDAVAFHRSPCRTAGSCEQSLLTRAGRRWLFYRRQDKTPAGQPIFAMTGRQKAKGKTLALRRFPA